ncbi:MAG: amino acid permease-domain-containing protein [Podila humilis]|nr:MAG: amino acid permease-domain-containing protein [Podila humilis]
MGTAAATQSGPSVTVSFLLGGFVSGIAALSYSEMASMIPIAGSAYTYAYASIGELAAWIIGWDLILEYLVGAATVSVGWSSYMTSFMKDAFNVELSTKWTNTPVVWIADDFKSSGDYFNAPAFFISVVISTTIYFGIHTTAKINNYLVAFKVLVLIVIIFSMIPFIKTSNYKPYIPSEEGFGVSGMLQGASTVFFAYIGFDSVSTTAQEAKEPQVNLPVGIIATILISTILYVGISVVTVGVAPYRDLGGRSPMVDAVRLTNMTWLVVLTELGALAATTSVILVLLIAQPRVFYSMANDGLIPRVFAKVHPVHKTPYVSTIVTGVLCSIFGGLLPINVLSDISSVGTIFAYFVVNIGVIILRYTRKTAPRRFKVPGGPFLLPGTGAASSLLLLQGAKREAIVRLLVWMALGLLVYFFYGRTHSEINNPRLIIDEPMRVLHEGYSVDDSGSYHGYTDDDLQEQYARQIARRNQYDRPRSGYYGSRRASRYTDQEMVMTTPNNGVNIIEGCQAPVQPNGGDNVCASPFETRANTSSTAVDSGVGIGSGIPSRHSSLSHADAFKKRHEFAQKQQDQREKQQQQHRPLQPLLQIHLQQHETMGLSDRGSGQSNPKDPSSSSSTSSAMSYRLEQYPETAHLSSR